MSQEDEFTKKPEADERVEMTPEEFRLRFVQVHNQMKRLREELRRLKPVSVEEANEALHELFPDLPEDWVLVKRRVFKRPRNAKGYIKP